MCSGLVPQHHRGSVHTRPTNAPEVLSTQSARVTYNIGLWGRESRPVSERSLTNSSTSQNTLFPTTVVGSMPRTAFVLELLQPETLDRLGPETTRSRQDDAVRYMIALMENTGIDIISDGEWRRASYSGVFSQMLDGFARGYVNRCVNDIRRRPSQPLIQWRFHPHTVHRGRRLRSTQGPSDA